MQSFSTTIKDIASLAKVSPSTVSRVLNSKKGASSENRRRILKLAEMMNYTPNLIAKSLVKREASAVGIVLPRDSKFVFSNPYYSEILKGISEVADRQGYYLLLNFLRGGNYASIYSNGVVGGIIILANRLDHEDTNGLHALRVPMVLIPGWIKEMDIPSVDVDNFNGAILAVGHLIELGHNKIAFLNGPMSSKYSIQRLAGYREAFARHGIGVDESLIIETDFSQASGHAAMGKLLSFRDPPTAVFCVNDVTAIGAYLAIRKRNLSVPEDISIVGFGDIPMASILEKPLTTVREPFVDLGRWAAKLILNLVRGKRLKEKHVVLPVELVLRSTTKEPRKGIVEKS